MMKPKTNWAAKQADLERLAAEGLRVREIAERLGVTRSAVIGRAHRVGVKLLDRSLGIVLAAGGTAEMFPCGHPRTSGNIFMSKRSNRLGYCTKCLACRQAYDRKRRKGVQ